MKGQERPRQADRQGRHTTDDGDGGTGISGIAARGRDPDAGAATAGAQNGTEDNKTTHDPRQPPSTNDKHPEWRG